MAASFRIEQHMGLLKKFAFQVRARMIATGTVTTEVQDIVQELAVAWCKARDKWDETSGVPFVAYLMKGMRDHVNAWAGKEIFHYNASHVHLDSEMSEGDDTEFHDLIADRSAENPEEVTVLKDRREKALAKLTPRARQFVELIESPPECLVKIVRALEARRKFAVARGVVAPIGAPKRVLPAMVFRFMGCSRLEQMKIGQELEKKFNIKAALSALDGVK